MEIVCSTPIFSISINGVGVSSLVKDRVISIRTSDAAGVTSDTCEISLDDYDGVLNIPKSEAILELSLGYQETGLMKIGSYYVKEISISGTRKTMEIKANAASKKMRSQISKTHDEASTGDMFSSMASEFGLDSAYDEDFNDIDVALPPQFAESGMNYLTRLGQNLGAIIKPTNGALVFANELAGVAASGISLPRKRISFNEIVEYSCSFKETEEGGSIGKVFSHWYNRETGEYVAVQTGSGEPEYEIDCIYSTESEAKAAANAKMKRIAKANRNLKFTVAGNPDLRAEHPVSLAGFPNKIPSNWIISNVEHRFDKKGFFTKLNCCNVLI